MRTLHQRRWFACLFFLSLLAGSGCAGKGEEPPAAPILHWAPMPRATHTTVRGWSGYRLLFEETVDDTTLTLDENLRRVIAAMDSVTVEVKGLGPAPGGDGEDVMVGHRRFPYQP